ncbi:MAG: prepilin-type N-terminal cleavage/methylation domain-containing protein [Thiohalomonadales bacterium]
MRNTHNHGFSLIELVLVIVVLSLLSAGLTKVFGQVTKGLSDHNDRQIAIQLAQECAEYLLGLRRQGGYAMRGNSNCDPLPLFGNNLLRPVVTESIVDSTTEVYCVSDCKKYAIASSYGSATARLTIMMASY